MSDEEVEAFAARLEAQVRGEDAKFRIEFIDGESEPLIANRERFLLLTANLLHGASAKADTLLVLPTPFDAQGDEFIFNKLMHREIWPQKHRKRRQHGKGASSFLIESGCVGVFIVILFSWASVL